MESHRISQPTSRVLSTLDLLGFAPHTAIVLVSCPVTQDFDHDSYMIWASDHMVYGPLDLTSLIQWVEDGRVVPKTWVLAQKRERWCLAESIEPLREYFAKDASATGIKPVPIVKAGVLAEELRQFPVFSGLTNQQLDQFIGFGELVEAPAGRVVLRRQDASDSLFFLISGELRARVMVGYEDKTLGHVKAGECFGETAMFMRTPRTADVVVESDARMLRVSSEAFLLLMNQLPQIAAPILFGIARVMAGRVCAHNQQHQRQVASEFLWR